MSKKIYKKESSHKGVKKIKIIGIFLVLAGVCITGYVFLPLFLWQFFIAPVMASTSLAVPIPRTTIVSPSSIKNLFISQASVLAGVDYTNASNWFPNFSHAPGTPRIKSYSITIPKLNINNASVSTVDDDLAHHLVNFQGTCVPPEKGNCVVFGHSTLPQLYNPKDYKTIFAYAQNLRTGDDVIVDAENILFTYKIFSITIVDPDDTSVLAQSLDDSYLSIITCTPPGTVWKRLVIKARLEKV